MMRIILLCSLVIMVSAGYWRHSVVINGPSGRISSRHESSSSLLPSRGQRPVKPSYPGGTKGGYGSVKGNIKSPFSAFVRKKPHSKVGKPIYQQYETYPVVDPLVHQRSEPLVPETLTTESSVESEALERSKHIQQQQVGYPQVGYPQPIYQARDDQPSEARGQVFVSES